MTKWSEHSEENKKAFNEWAERRSNQLLRLVEDTELRILRYLMVTNSGGAIALLSFLGTSEYARSLPGLKFSLALFIIGIIICGVLATYGAHHMSHLFRDFKKDLSDFYEDEYEWKEFFDRDSGRSKYAGWVLPLAYIAFGCFIVGSSIGLWHLFS